MGFFKSLFSVNALFDEVINVQRNAYFNIEERLKQNNVKYDHHHILAKVWASRKYVQNGGDADYWLNGGLITTVYFSMLEKEDSIVALGCMFFIEESSERIKQTDVYLKAKSIYVKKMELLANLTEEKTRDDFYKRKNPVTYEIIKKNYGTLRDFIESVET